MRLSPVVFGGMLLSCVVGGILTYTSGYFLSVAYVATARFSMSPTVVLCSLARRLSVRSRLVPMVSL